MNRGGGYPLPEEALRKQARFFFFLLALLAAALAPASAQANWREWITSPAPAGPYYSNASIAPVGVIAWFWSVQSQGGAATPCISIQYRIKNTASNFRLAYSADDNARGLSITVINTRSFATLPQNRIDLLNGRYAQIYSPGGSDGPPVGTHTITIELRNLGGSPVNNATCNPHNTLQDITFTMTVAQGVAWSELDDHSDEASGSFSPVAVSESNSRTDTGLAFHHNYTGCQKINVTYNGPASMELRRYAGNSEAADQGLTNIHMENDATGDNHVRLMIKAGATLTAGSVVTATVTGTGHSSCTGQAPTTGDAEVEWKVTVATPASWTEYSRDDMVAEEFDSASLNAANSNTDTGLAFQRYAASACTFFVVSLTDSSNEIFALRGYLWDPDTRQGTPQQGFVQSFGNGNNRNMYAKVFFRSGYVHSGGTVTVTMVARGNAVRCGASQPRPLTLQWPVTITETGWTDQGEHSDAASGAFSPVTVSENSGRTDTGLAFHQSYAACRRINVALGSGAPDSVELRRYAGNSETADQSLTNIRMEKDDTADNHVRLMIKAGAALTAGEVLTATVTGAAYSTCATGGPDGPTIEWKVTVATPDTWVVRDANRDSAEADDDFTSTGLNAAGTATDTGLSFYRAVSSYDSSRSGCTEYSLELSDGSNAIFGLRTYTDQMASRSRQGWRRR